MRRDPRPRRPRPRRPARRVRAGRRGDRSPVGDLRLHDQGMAAARPRAIPANHSALLDGGAVGAAGGASWAPTPSRSVGARFATGSPEAELCRTAARSGCAASRSSLGDAAAGRRPTLGREHAGDGVDPAGVRAVLRRPRPRGARRRGAGRDGQPRRRVVDEPRRLDQPRRASGTSASGSTGSPTTPTRSCAGASPSTASTSSSGSPRATSSGCSAELGADVVARRPAAAADRDAV